MEWSNLLILVSLPTSLSLLRSQFHSTGLSRRRCRFYSMLQRGHMANCLRLYIDLSSFHLLDGLKKCYLLASNRWETQSPSERFIKRCNFRYGSELQASTGQRPISRARLPCLYSLAIYSLFCWLVCASAKVMANLCLHGYPTHNDAVSFVIKLTTYY